MTPGAFATAYAASARISGRTTAATTSIANNVAIDISLGLAQPVLGALRMRRQPFAVRERRGDRPEHLRCGLGHVQQARPLLEVVDAERRREARRAPRRK